jgi:hypothetical protein
MAALGVGGKHGIDPALRMRNVAKGDAQNVTAER